MHDQNGPALSHRLPRTFDSEDSRQHGDLFWMTQQELQGVINLVWRVLCSMSGTAHLHEDVVQQTLLALWLHFPKRPSGGIPWSWIARAARNSALNMLRRKRPVVDSRVTDAANTETAAEDRHLSARLDALAESLPKLSARARRIISLHYLDGRCAREIAALLDTTRAAVWATLHRARRELRRLIVESEQ